jgi:hypothetical protein
MVLVHVYVEVTEANLGIDFYCHGLGLILKRRLSPTWIELAGANCPLYLLANRPAIADLGSTKVCRSYERHWTPVHLDFVVSDIDATVSRLIALGLIAKLRFANTVALRTWQTHLGTAWI